MATTEAKILTFACLLSVATAACKETKDESADKPAPMVLGKKEEPEGPVQIPPGMLAGFKPSLPTEFTKAGQSPSAELVDLGKKLYFDPRLSKNHDVACVTCHALDKFGVDGLAVSVGHR